MTGPTNESSATSTLNRSSKNRLGLLLKQYYDDPALMGAPPPGEDEYSLARLEKLKTDALMGKSVESLRSYKEAESELRMLLYNNCDKLLKAVHVVCEIRQGSRDVEVWAQQLHELSKRRESVPTNPVIADYNNLLLKQKILDSLLMLEQVPTLLVHHDHSLEERIQLYLRLREQIFEPLSPRFKLIDSIANRCRTVVETELVPLLMSGTTATRARVAVLMDLFPRGHARHGEVMEQFVELEVASFDEKLRTCAMTATPSEALGILNSVVNVLFASKEFEDAGLIGEKISQDLVPRASALVLTSLEKRAFELKSVDEILDFAQTARNGHMRIPLVSREFLKNFTTSALLAWITFQFKSAARLCIGEYLAPLLAASAFGACCDVIHTRCCTVIALANDALSRSESEDEEGLSSSTYQAIEGLVSQFYADVSMPASPASDDNEELFQTLIKGMKMQKFLFSRNTLDRTLNALGDIFGAASSPDKHGSGNDVLVASMHNTIKLLGEWVQDCPDRLERAVKEGLLPVLDASTLNSSGSTLSKKRPSELAATEMVHARKLVLPSPGQALPTLDLGAFMVCAIYLKACRETVINGGTLSGPIVDRIPEWIEKLVGGPGSDYGLTLEAMARDLGSSI
jgi:hypothetical protein